MKVIIAFIFSFVSVASFCQSKKVELFDLVKKLIHDSSLYSETGDWAVGSPLIYPIQWQNDRLEMSDDEKINFFRKGTVNISINGATLYNLNKPMRWNIMLKGPRMGYTSFNIESVSNKQFKPKNTIDSVFGNKQYTFKLLKDCSSSYSSGFYYYQVLIPKKVLAWIKLSWSCSSGNCKISIDCYDYWSKQYAEIICPK
jgi:hypothetical protein